MRHLVGLVGVVSLLGSCSSSKTDGKNHDLAVGDFAIVDQAPPDGAGAPLDLDVPARCNGATATVAPAGPAPTAVTFTLPTGFAMQGIAAVPAARELAALPNGDLLVGTSNSSVYLVPNAEGAAAAGKPTTFVTIADNPVQGVTFVQSSCTIYVGTQNGVYSIPYVDGDTSGTATKIAAVRSGPLAANPDDKHITTSVAFTNGTLYVAVGSDCNACAEADPDRAAILEMGPAGEVPAIKATRVRNAIGLAVNPATGTLWAGGAGQDDLPPGHPYEFFDAVGLHKGEADYGWPDCEENHVAYVTGSDCSAVVEPLVELPAYSTIIGAVFYPQNQTGTYAFPVANRGVYLGTHGSWHMLSGSSSYYTAPRVAFVPMSTKAPDAPATAVNWSQAKVEGPVTGLAGQWSEFVGGYQAANGVDRSGRPTGVAVGVQGSLFVADDQNGAVYRVRPTH